MKPISNQVDRWRAVAMQFHAIYSYLQNGMLSPDFQPHDLAKLRRKVPMTSSIKGIISFLIHIWDHSNPFDLSGILNWDNRHREAFAKWVTGRITGQACHYF